MSAVYSPRTSRPIPRYARNLNTMAESAALSVSIATHPNDAGEMRLWFTWEGLKVQLQSLGLLTPAHAMSLHYRKSSIVIVPSSEPSWRWEGALLTGRLENLGERFRWEIDGGPALFSLEERDGLEIITYADTVVYHGSREALLAAGCAHKRLPTGKNGGRSSGGWWCTPPIPSVYVRRQPDGSFVWRQQSDADFRADLERDARQRNKSALGIALSAEIRRLAVKPSKAALRLVVDNTHPEDKP